jgi:hypothetical protein
MDIFQYLSKIPSFSSYSRRNKILLIAYFLREYNGILTFTAKEITDQCKGVTKDPSKTNLCLMEMSKGKGAPILKSSSKEGFSLSLSGLEEVQDFLSKNTTEFLDAFYNDAINYLTKVVTKVSENNKRKFLTEAIICLKVNSNRATIIMLWVCVVDHLYEYVLKYKLVDFNAELKKANSKRIIKCKDDFSDIKEERFIELLRASNIISNDVRKILDEKRGIRNSAVHPSGIEIHLSKVMNFVEDLVDNIILKYKL